LFARAMRAGRARTRRPTVGVVLLGALALALGAACSDSAEPSARAPSPGAEPARADEIAPAARFDFDVEASALCGGLDRPRCPEGQRCRSDDDCVGACSYAHTCVDAPSCKRHLGGDTCGAGEVGEPGASHESCCRSLPVRGFTAPAHPGKTVYLDKYEITAGRVRAFLEAMIARHHGRPDVRRWIGEAPPLVWDDAWSAFLPSDFDGATVHVARRLLGDVRGLPDTTPVPDHDQDQKTGIDFQFNGQPFVYLHGGNCSTHVGSYGFPTWFYPADVLAKMGPTFPPRADGELPAGAVVPASEHLDVKAMNCITNALLAAFCHWDGGQLATSEVLDYATGSPPDLGDDGGCGAQTAERPPESLRATSGGRCADLAKINATFDAGGQLPKPNSPLNANHYAYPFFADDVTHDKAWEIAAPGRGSLAAGGAPVDMVRLAPGDEPWMDLAGNLNEAVLTTTGGVFTGRFGLKYRGIGYGTARSRLNTRPDWPGEGGLRRIERPEAKAAFTGGRCMRFR
jgi:hypothetical protein